MNHIILDIASSGLHRPCRDLLNGEEMWKITGKHKPWYTLPLIYHYARSLEKYVLKQQTWDTAGQGQDYDINNYFMRLSGFTFDNSAVKWGCQVREVLRNYTGEADYVRPGDFWYRNPVSDLIFTSSLL